MKPRTQYLFGTKQLGPLTRGEDLRHALNSAEQQWFALSMPCETGDHASSAARRLRKLMDRGGDGRIRVGDVRSAMKFAIDHCVDLDAMMHSTAVDMPLDAIDASTPRGTVLLEATQEVLGDGKTSTLNAHLVHAAAKKAASGPFNGDGVIQVSSALAAWGEASERTAAVVAAMKDIMKMMGGVVGAEGEMGIDENEIRLFFEALVEHARTYEGLEADALLLGDVTDAAFSALTAVEARIDDYFERCRLAAYVGMKSDPASSSEAKERRQKALEDILEGGDGLKTSLEHLPLAYATPAAVLPLSEGINPGDEAAIERFRRQTLEPLEMSTETLTSSAWKELKGKFSRYRKFVQTVSNNPTAALPLTRVHDLLQGDVKADLLTLIEMDAQARPRVSALRDLDFLVHLYVGLGTFLRNFISFEDFARDKHRSFFQIGSLVMDGRRASLVLHVENGGVLEHAKIATRSSCFLVYCECTREGETRTIVAAFTEGSSENLYVGRRGVFTDNAGNDFDARAIHVIENPIGLKEAALSPYRQAVALIESILARQAEGKVDKDVVKKFDVGVVAAFFVGFGAVSTAIATFMNAFAQLGWLMPLGFAGIVTCISGPPVALAWVRSRSRALGPILEASGWAINKSPKLTLLLGQELTTAIEQTSESRQRARNIKFSLAFGMATSLAIGAWTFQDVIKERIEMARSALSGTTVAVKDDVNGVKEEK